MSWQRVDLVVDGALAEMLADALEAEGAVSTEISDAGAGTAAEHAIFGEPGGEGAMWPHARVRALFGDDAQAPRALERALAAAGVPSSARASIDTLEDADWVALTQRQFAPIRAGERLWIVPTWHQAPDCDAINIVLDPGAAFGTGSHPTTRLVLAWLERNVRAGDAVLDYGCGSGILAIAALKLGAGRAVAIDIDPLALEAARYNSRSNDVPLEVTDAQTGIRGAAEITVANILANPLRMLAPLLASHTKPGGKIALCGILEEQVADVALAYAPWAVLEVVASEGGWVLLAGTRNERC